MLSDVPNFFTDEIQQAIDAWYLADENNIVDQLIPLATLNEDAKARVQSRAMQLVHSMRDAHARQGGIDSFLTAYDLSSEEGIALMCVAESLLRIPDAPTVQNLIRDKIGSVNWQRHLGQKDHLFVNAATWGLMLTGNVMTYSPEKPHRLRQAFNTVLKRGGVAVLYRAMRRLSKQFVMGADIQSAIKRAESMEKKGYRYSYDMLGEAARTTEDAKRYFEAYQHAILETAEAAKGKGPIEGPGISIKLSALHPRYEVAQHQRVCDELLPQLKQLVYLARDANLNLTIDAEEAARLNLSLFIFEKIFSDPNLGDWSGLGLAVQAYQKRALPVLKYLTALSARVGRKMMVRLVKGAYWDYEIKVAQVQGLSGYPVFTRKTATDIAYLACARYMLNHPDEIFSQFATHNAHSVATILEWAGDSIPFEFQCLHGMGNTLYTQLVGKNKGQYPCRIYAPVGEHEDLLAYLVRRMLENGANSAFVNRIVHQDIPVSDLISDPIETWMQYAVKAHPAIPLPAKLYGDARDNSPGIDLNDDLQLNNLQRDINITMQQTYHALPQLADSVTPSVTPSEIQPVYSPNDMKLCIGEVSFSTLEHVDAAFQAAEQATPMWSAQPLEQRVMCLSKLADLLFEHRATLMMLLMREAGKTGADAVSELREAIDFCHYYAAQAQIQCTPKTLVGPTGELNTLQLQGRGIMLAISPWNFPLAIFLGQISAALVTGNVVIAKPAEQTNLIAAYIVSLAHQAGIPKAVLQCLPGQGEVIGQALVSDARVDGVLFTGSSDTANHIQQSLAAKSGPIVPFVAETGGQNVMLVDSTALPEQVVVDVVQSAFGSAGQRCSACRVLYVQEEVADSMIEMLIGYLETWQVGDSTFLSTDCGPVIDTEALARLTTHRMHLDKTARHLYTYPLSDDLPQGHYFAPCIYEIPSITVLTQEIFGPILHIVRFKVQDLESIIEEINSTGYGLTFGVHSRLDERIEFLIKKIKVGNIYVNRNMIGAVVGVQPFGGEGLSGTGPKAGGPYYLPRLCVERSVCENTTAMGGNTTLLAISAQAQ